MKRRNVIISSFLFSTLIFSCNNTDRKENETLSKDTIQTTIDTPSEATSFVNTVPLAKEDSLFLFQAANVGLVEAEFANFAQHRAKHQRIKDFAVMVFRDHIHSNQELKNLATSRNLELPDTIGTKYEGHLQKLLTPGINFDKIYMELMLKEHTEAVFKFEKASGEIKDSQLKLLVEKMLQVLKVHRDSAQAIDKAKVY